MIEALPASSFIFYLLLLVAIGVISARFFTKSLSEFFLGGRKMKDWVVALSAVVSGRSAWLILGMSGMAYALGVSAIWAVVGYIVVELFLFLFVGKRLRRYTQATESITLPDFFEARFKDNLHTRPSPERYGSGRRANNMKPRINTVKVRGTHGALRTNLHG